MKKHIVISGKVQGVGFRYWLCEAAMQRNIDGWVKNKISGEVEALLIGNDTDVNYLIKLCEKGPPSSEVTKGKVQSYQREYLKKLSPDRFEDIIAMISLYRTGPMEYIDNYIKRKHGKEDIIYLHPKLETVLLETYGITIYQEQVMKIAQTLAGFTLSQADTLRWAIGKRKRTIMSSLKKHFINGCVKNGVKEYQAESIFKQVETFAGYGFNKSHAAGYALIAYQTSFLKANFPVEFMTASINYELNNVDKINRYLDDSKNMNIEILKPNINYSSSLFTIELNSQKKKSIRY